MMRSVRHVGSSRMRPGCAVTAEQRPTPLSTRPAHEKRNSGFQARARQFAAGITRVNDVEGSSGSSQSQPRYRRAWRDVAEQRGDATPLLPVDEAPGQPSFRPSRQVPSTSRPRQLSGYRAGLLKLAMSLRLSDLVARRIDMPLETFVLFATIAMPLALSLSGLPLHLQAVPSEQAIIALLAAATAVPAALASNLWRTAQGAFRAAALLCWPSGAVDKLFHRSVVVEAAKCSVGTLSSSLLFTAHSTQFPSYSGHPYNSACVVKAT
jgi:hypothetical protein